MLLLGNTVLHIAAQNGRADIIDDLLLAGANINKGNNHKNTAIHLAAQNGWTEVMAKMLRAKRININAKDLHANTALHLAAQNGQIGVLCNIMSFSQKKTHFLSTHFTRIPRKRIMIVVCSDVPIIVHIGNGIAAGPPRN